MNNAIIICLVIAGFAVACLGIYKDGEAKASRRAHQEAMQRSEAAAKLWKGVVGPDVRAKAQADLDKASAEGEAIILGKP